MSEGHWNGNDEQEGVARCADCDEIHDAENMTDGLCQSCYDSEWLECDECGAQFQRSESDSDKHCPDCLESSGLICIVCGAELADESDNQGDADNPVCGGCVDSVREDD